MSLRHALLGLLADRPASGYDLTRVFEASLAQYAWHARHSQIYPELNKLAGEGLVTVVGSGARNRRTYGLTDEGRAELYRWLLGPQDTAGVRNERVLRMFLLTALPPDDARTVLERFAADGERRTADMAAIRASDESALGFGQFAAEFGLRYFRMQAEWARWALERLEQAEPDAPETDEARPGTDPQQDNGSQQSTA